MRPILIELLALVQKGATHIELPGARLAEFLDAGTEHRFFTMEEMEKFRRACIAGEAKAWGVPVTFTQ